MLNTPDMIDYAKAMVRFYTKYRDDLIQHEKFPEFLGEYYDDELINSVNQIIANLRTNLQDEKVAEEKARNTGLNSFKEKQKEAWLAISNNIVDGETLWRRIQVKLENATNRIEEQAKSSSSEKPDNPHTIDSKVEKKYLESFLESLKKVREILSVGITVKALIMTQYAPLLDGLKSVLEGIKLFHF